MKKKCFTAPEIGLDDTDPCYFLKRLALNLLKGQETDYSNITDRTMNRLFFTTKETMPNTSFSVITSSADIDTREA